MIPGGNGTQLRRVDEEFVSVYGRNLWFFDLRDRIEFRCRSEKPYSFQYLVSRPFASMGEADIAKPAHGQVNYLVVGADQGGQRIDNFLIRHLKGVPRSHIYRILRGGEVRVNRSRVKPSFRVSEGDRVRVPPLRGAARENATLQIPEAVQKAVEEAILLEDENLIVLNKPSGLAVHAGSGLAYGIIEILRHSRAAAPLLELVHRLDRATSGCLLVAKRREILLGLHQALRQGRIEKIYLALVAGRWPESERYVSAPLSRPVTGRGHRRVEVAQEGRDARTEMRVLRRFRQASLLEVRLLTGRTHQIRVHAAHLGHPLAGDEKYGDFSFNREMRRLGLRRLFLHARDLSFQDLTTGRRYRVRAPLDPSLQRVLDRLSE